MNYPKYITNRKEQHISMLVDRPNNPQGLIFVMHGLGGSKYESHIALTAKAFYDNNYTVVRFDTTNSFGESDGNYEDATVTNYYQDLEDVILRSQSQDFCQDKFILCGHSLGGMCVLLYAENHPEHVKAILPLSAAISGNLSKETYSPEKLEEREQTGRRIQERSNGGIKKLKRSHMVDRCNYDVLKRINLVQVPTLIVVGEDDTQTPVNHQQILYESLSGPKELHIIKECGHVFRTQEALDHLYEILSKRVTILN